MAVAISTTVGDIDGRLFTGVEIDTGTWSVVADVKGYPDPVVVSDHANEADALVAIRALTEELASEGAITIATQP